MSILNVNKWRKIKCVANFPGSKHFPGAAGAQIVSSKQVLTGMGRGVQRGGGGLSGLTGKPPPRAACTARALHTVRTPSRSLLTMGVGTLLSQFWLRATRAYVRCTEMVKQNILHNIQQTTHADTISADEPQAGEGAQTSSDDHSSLIFFEGGGGQRRVTLGKLANPSHQTGLKRILGIRNQSSPQLSMWWCGSKHESR